MGAAVVDRLVQAARARGGERLELASGRPAVLIAGEARLQAGKTVIALEDLEGWLEERLPRELWVVLQLGKEVEARVEAAGEAVRLSARRVAEVLRVTLELKKPSEDAPAVGEGAGRGVRFEPPAVLHVAPDRPLDRMLARLVELGGSDLHLSAGCAPLMRLHGEMQPLPGFPVPLSSDHIQLLLDEIAPASIRQELQAERDTDFAYEVKSVARFRVNAFYDRRGVGAVFRRIPNRLMTFEELGLPECVQSLCSLSKGLVLVTGPTGSGKSTTLATMVDHINATRTDHIITIEDPIEFVHENRRCLVNQREVHTHTSSFKRALRAALREDPDVVLVGELRDLETMAIAIETAETGHLVLATLHTTTAVATVDRIVDQFPPERQAQIRVMLADSLKGVVAQVLLRRIGGGQVAAFEILLGIPAVANLIREGKTFQLPTVMQTNRRLGMRLMNDSLAELVRDGKVELEEALAKSVDREALRALLKLPRAEL
jgi:twitching motility protein PilT